MGAKKCDECDLFWNSCSEPSLLSVCLCVNVCDVPGTTVEVAYDSGLVIDFFFHLSIFD